MIQYAAYSATNQRAILDQNLTGHTKVGLTEDICNQEANFQSDAKYNAY